MDSCVLRLEKYTTFLAPHWFSGLSNPDGYEEPQNLENHFTAKPVVKYI